MESLTQDQIKQLLIKLKTEHRDLDSLIGNIISRPGIDQIRIQRLKKRKLALKDEIARLENMLLPDIIA
ncbi:MAG: YdcH family protein [Alphaproteobacteria bacterium]